MAIDNSQNLRVIKSFCVLSLRLLVSAEAEEKIKTKAER